MAVWSIEFSAVIGFHSACLVCLLLQLLLLTFRWLLLHSCHAGTLFTMARLINENVPGGLWLFGPRFICMSAVGHNRMGLMHATAC